MKTWNPCISLSEALDLLEDEEFACEDIQVVVLPPDPDQASDEDEGNDDDTAAPIVNDVPGTVEVDFRPGPLEEEQFEDIDNIILTEEEGASNSRGGPQRRQFKAVNPK